MAEKLSRQELHDRLKTCPSVGSKYRHYKGGEYTVVGAAIDEASQRCLVLYTNFVSPVVLMARPLTVWEENVSHDGVVQPRFARIE